MARTIKRTMWGVVSEDNEILAGEKISLRFVPIDCVSKRDMLVLYGSKATAESALNFSWYFDKLVRHKKYRIVPVTETFEIGESE